MDEGRNRFWRFGVADLLGATTVVGLGIGLFPSIRRIQPLIDPVFLAVMLTSLLGFALAAFVGRRQSTTLIAGCSILAAVCGIVLVRICQTKLQ